MDTSFSVKDGCPEELPVLVLKDTGSGPIACTEVLNKGPAAFPVQFAARNFECEVIIESSFELTEKPAIEAISEAKCAERAIRNLQTVLRTGPRYISSTMGVLDRAPTNVSLVYTHKFVTKRNLEVNLNLNSVLLP